MANYLVAKCNTVTKSYELKTAEPNKPYLRVSNSYLPLSSGNTTTGLQVKVNGNNCGIQESYTTTVSSSTYTYSRITYYDCTNANFRYTKTTSANFQKLCTTYGWNYDSYYCKNSITVSISTTCYCDTGYAKINTTLSYSTSVSGDQIHLATYNYADNYMLNIDIKFRNYLDARSMVRNTSFFFKRPLDIDNSGNINRYTYDHEINKTVTMICTDGQILYLVPGRYFDASNTYTKFVNSSYLGSYTTKNTYYIYPGNEYYSSAYSASDLFFKKVESMQYIISANNMDSGNYYQSIFPLIANITMSRGMMSTGRYTYTRIEDYRINYNYITTCTYSTYTSSTFNYNCAITTTARVSSYTTRHWDGQTVTSYRTSNISIYLYRIQESQSWYTKTYSLTTTSQ